MLKKIHLSHGSGCCFRGDLMGDCKVQQHLLRQVTVGDSELLSYYLIESEEPLEDGGAYAGYGIRIQGQHAAGEDSLRGVSSNREYTISILHVLADAAVYPIHLRDILCDLLS